MISLTVSGVGGKPLTVSSIPPTVSQETGLEGRRGIYFAGSCRGSIWRPTEVNSDELSVRRP